MRAGRYTPAVTFLSVNRSSDALATTQRSVVLAVNESKQVAHAVSPGTQLTIGNQTVGEIVSVAATPDGPESRAELIGIDVTAYSQGDTAWFGGREIRVNNRLTVVTDQRGIPGRGVDFAAELDGVGWVDRGTFVPDDDRHPVVGSERVRLLSDRGFGVGVGVQIVRELPERVRHFRARHL
jgi:hypothetical protein